MRKESKYSQTVILRDPHRAFSSERVAVVHPERSGAAGESAAVGPDDHRAPLGRGLRGSPDVEIETVFAGRGSRSAGRSALLLRAHGAKLVGFANALPMRWRAWLMPAQIAE